MAARCRPRCPRHRTGPRRCRAHRPVSWRQRGALGLIGSVSGQSTSELDIGPALQPVEDGQHRLEDLGADAVTGQQQQLVLGHSHNSVEIRRFTRRERAARERPAREARHSDRVRADHPQPRFRVAVSLLVCPDGRVVAQRQADLVQPLEQAHPHEPGRSRRPWWSGPVR